MSRPILNGAVRVSELLDKNMSVGQRVRCARLSLSGHNIHAALHVVSSEWRATCPLGEFLLNWMPSKTHFEKYPSRSCQWNHRIAGSSQVLVSNWDERKWMKMESVTSL
ncbi:MAG: hypothetical protein U5K79_25675 [Cyclobacteriaceae bacterium]|nr:hypothetical protein [Cyclobacteriaceae bacterium]